MTSSRRDIATSLLDRSFRSSAGSNRAGSVASEGGEGKKMLFLQSKINVNIKC